MVNPRYHRQSLIGGWDQEKWSNLSAVVVGDSHLGQHVADCLVGTGIGKITLVGNTGRKGKVSLDGFLTHEATSDGSFVVDEVAFLLGKVNPKVEVYSLAWYPRGKYPTFAVEDAPLIFDATNDSVTAQHLMKYASEHDTFLVRGSCGGYRGVMKVQPAAKHLSDFAPFDAKPQNPVSALVIAGLMVEEARKRFMPYNNSEQPHDEALWYNLHSRDRFSQDDDFGIPVMDLHDWNILIAGCGALGMPVSVSLSSLNPSTIGLLDYEKPDESNIARQTLYYDCVDRPKAEALCEKLAHMNPNVPVIPHVAKLVASSQDAFSETTPDELKTYGYNVALRCFDNFAATVLLGKLGIPVIYGGTSYSTASVSSYVPKVTSCLDCTMGASIQAEDEVDRDSCDLAPEPSIITTSKICAGIMAGEAILLCAGLTHELINGTIEYDTFHADRFAINRLNTICAGDHNG